MLSKRESSLQCSMSTPSPKKSKYLFSVQLDEDELNALVHLDENLLKNLLGRCSRTFQKLITDSFASSLFLTNYRMLMELHSNIFSNNISVNLCLHFALLYSQRLLLLNKQTEAKCILKQTQNYVNIADVDPILMTACINNLTLLYSRHGKVYKALAVALRGISIMEEHLEQLKSMKNRGKLIEDVVIFVNLLMLTQNALKRILQNNSKNFFKTLFKIVNRLGYSFATKYLGNDSIFTKKFYLPEDSVLLPVYHSEQQLQEEEEHDHSLQQFKLHIATELETIYQSLKELNLEPEVYYIREQTAPKQVIKQPNIVQSFPQDQVKQVQKVQYSPCYHGIFPIGNYSAQISLTQQPNETRIYPFLGHIKINIKELSLNQNITQEQLLKIVTCINVHDVLPYQYDLKGMYHQQFLGRVLLHFLTVRDNSIMIVPRVSLLQPFQYTFCGGRTLIFFNHIHFRTFRVAICPIETSETLYLELEFKDKDIYKEMKLTEIQSAHISELAHHYISNKDIPNKHLNYGRFKKIALLHPDQFKLKITHILQEFEHFLTLDNTTLTELTSYTIDESMQPYYQYQEMHPSKGQFFQLKYRSNSNLIEITVQNTYKTHTPHGLANSKGNTLYSPQQFLKDFGIPLKSSRKDLPAFFPIITQKYNLKIFEEPIQEADEDRYQQNAITEQQITSKFFNRSFIQFQDYMLPVTIEVISINNQKPIGIKAHIYEPIKCIQSGIFIHLNPEYWEKPPEKDTLHPVDIQLDHHQSQHNFRKVYFLTQWLQMEGFEKIFKRLIIVNRSLSIRDINAKYCRLEELL